MKWKNAREIIQNVPFLPMKFQHKICKMKTWAQDINLYEVVVMIARKKKSRNLSDCHQFNFSVFWFWFLFFLRFVVNTFFSILHYFPILNQKVSKMIQMIMNPDQSQIISFLGGVRWVNFYYSSLFFHFKRKDVQDDIQMITNPDQSQIIS